MDTSDKWFFIFLIVAVIVVSGGAFLYEQQSAKSEQSIAEQCLSSGGQWVTRSVTGHPENHDCVRKD